MHRTLILALSLALAAPAFAGADSPLPELVTGQTTYHLFTVPGGVASFGLDTYFGCTSLEETATVQVGVELFAGPGGAPFNDAAATSRDAGLLPAARSVARYAASQASSKQKRRPSARWRRAMARDARGPGQSDFALNVRPSFVFGVE